MKTKWILGALLMAALGAVAPGCGSPDGSDAGDSSADAQPDRPVAEAAADVAPDVTEDVTPDVTPKDAEDVPPPDVAEDVAMDAPVDMGVDAPVDVPVDMGIDAGMDVAVDAPADVAPDVAPDVPVDAPPACPVVRALMTTDMHDGTLMGMSRSNSTTCQPLTNGPEDVFSLRITTRTGIELSTDDPRTTIDTVLAIRRTCFDRATEIACSDDRSASTRSTLRAVLDPGDYFVVVDQYGSGTPTGGPYRLRVSTYTPAANATCGTATALTPGMTLMGQDSATGGAPSVACNVISNGAQLFYSLVIPAGQRATVTATPAAGQTAVVRILDSCTATSCLAAGQASAGMPSSAVGVNTGMSPRTVIVAVSSTAPDAPLMFGLSATLGPAAPNADCATPTTLMPGTMLTGQSTANGAGPSLLCRTGDVGTQVFYALTVPANARANITATPTDMGRAVLRVLDGCPGTQCLASTGSSSAGTAATLPLVNATAMPQQYIVSVASNVATAPLMFNIVATITPLAANATCGGALTLAPTMPRAMQDNALGGPASTQCLTGDTGNQLFYAVTIPANNRVTVTATPTSMPPRSFSMRVLDSCMATSCLASASGANAISFANPSATPRTVLVSVSTTSSTLTGTFDLAAAFTMLAPNANCGAATTLTPGMTLTMQDTALGGAASTQCRTGDAGNQLFYTLRVPARSRATVTATSTNAPTRTMVVRVLDTCAATGCLTNNSGTAASLNIDNASGTARDYIVAVSTTSATLPSTFDLSAAVSPMMLAYTETTFAGTCDDMTGSMVLPTITTDDSASPSAALPFTFRFFGTDYGFYSATSNGFAQFHTAAGVAGNTTFTNTRIPNAAIPNNFVAPFWDDLRPLAGMMSDVRVVTIGMAPMRRFVIQWTNWSLPGLTSRMTFQAKLYETTNVVEFVYCNLTPGTGAEATRVFGDQATVGIENAAGTDGVQRSFDSANSVSTMTSVRYTPAP